MPVSGLMVKGKALLYGDPKAFPQKMKNLDISNAFLGPICGPHLYLQYRCTSNFSKMGESNVLAAGGLPILDISAA